MSLENKVAIITGGASGIGYAIAEHLVRARAKVVIADIDKVAGKKAAKTLQKINSTTFVHCDVSQKLDVHNLVATTLDIHKNIDLLVNNAAVINDGDFLSIKEDDFDRVLDVNLKGSFLCAQAVGKHMVEAVQSGRKPGSIINLSSVNANFAIANKIPDSITKGGANPLTKVMAQSLIPHGIRVNAIGPGSIMSKILKVAEIDESAKQHAVYDAHLDQLVDPCKIAKIVEYLISDEATNINGQTIFVDDLPKSFLNK